VAKEKTLEEVMRDARKFTFGPVGKRYTPCPYGCGLINDGKFAKHLKRVHSGGHAPASKGRKVEVVSPKSTDALLRSVSGGRTESNRRKH
jgi:hypothetical protein